MMFKYRIKDTRLVALYPNQPEKWYLSSNYYVRQNGEVWLTKYGFDSKYSYQDGCVIEEIKENETLVEEMVREGLIKDPYEK